MQKICDFFSVNFDYFLENNVSQNNTDNKNSAISVFGNTTVNNTIPENIINLILQNQKQIFEMISQQNQLIEKFINKS